MATKFLPLKVHAIRLHSISYIPTRLLNGLNLFKNCFQMQVDHEHVKKRWSKVSWWFQQKKHWDCHIIFNLHNRLCVEICLVITLHATKLCLGIRFRNQITWCHPTWVDFSQTNSYATTIQITQSPSMWCILSIETKTCQASKRESDLAGPVNHSPLYIKSKTKLSLSLLASYWILSPYVFKRTPLRCQWSSHNLVFLLFPMRCLICGSAMSRSFNSFLQI